MAKRKTPLRRWCDKFGHGARSEIAKRAGLRYQTVHDLYKGKRVALPNTARKIEEATDGQVPWESLIEQ